MSQRIVFSESLQRGILLCLGVAVLCLTGCASSGGRKMQLADPTAQSGTGSEAIWYQDGGARWAYTAIPRPRQLYTGPYAVRDPALYEAQTAPTSIPKARRAPAAKSAPKAAPKTPVRDPNCPPCPPAGAEAPNTLPAPASARSPEAAAQAAVPAPAAPAPVVVPSPPADGNPPPASRLPLPVL